MVKPLIGFGVGLLAFGFYWKLYEDTITGFFISYVRDTGDKYYLLSDLVWDALPYFVILVGVVCLIFGSKTTVSSEGGD